MTPLYWALAKVAAIAILAGVAYLLRRQLVAVGRLAAAEVRKRPLVWGIALALVAAVLAAWKVPIWQLESRTGSLAPDRYLELENSYRATIVQALAGVALLVTIYLTWRRVAATEQQVEVAREEQITERFTRAIEQLGSGKLEVRLGGIYALERIARDSERDHWPVMEVLTAYVRENAYWGDNPEEDEMRQPLATDVQAVLTVLGRRRVAFDGPGRRLDLRKANLSWIALAGADLRRADLSSAILSGGNLTSANLSAASLARALLSHTDLSDANLSEADLIGARLAHANLIGTTLREARLAASNLYKAVLCDVSFEAADLVGARLSEATVKSANLTQARLLGTDLRRVDLRQVIGLTRDQLAHAITDETTILPGYLKKQKEEPAQEGVQGD